MQFNCQAWSGYQNKLCEWVSESTKWILGLLSSEHFHLLLVPLVSLSDHNILVRTRSVAKTQTQTMQWLPWWRGPGDTSSGTVGYRCSELLPKSFVQLPFLLASLSGRLWLLWLQRWTPAAPAIFSNSLTHCRQKTGPDGTHGSSQQSLRLYVPSLEPGVAYGVGASCDVAPMIEKGRCDY